MNWSGYAYDASRHLLIVNTNNLAAKVKLIPQAVFNDPAQRTEKGEYTGQAGTPYGMFRTFLMSPSGLPCIPPPWGTLTALDLSSGTIRWQVPLGSFDSGAPERAAGTLSLGGPIVTARRPRVHRRDMGSVHSARSTSRRARSCGRRGSRSADTRRR